MNKGKVEAVEAKAASMVAEVSRSLARSYTCTHAVTPMQIQITPCTAQVAGHTSDKIDPAKLRETSATILAAQPCFENGI